MQSLQQRLSSNSMLWEQMAEAEKREHVLRQELLITQQTLSNCEKIIDKQKDTIKLMETDKVRLLNFKESKGKRLEELEQKVAQYQAFSKVNVDKLIQVLYKQKEELESLRGANENFESMFLHQAKKNRDELQAAHQKYLAESQIKSRAVQQLEELRSNISDDQAKTASFWREKCQSIYNLCLEIKEERDSASDKCKELADMAVELMAKLHELQTLTQRSTAHESLIGAFDLGSQKKVRDTFSLPRLVGIGLESS